MTLTPAYGRDYKNRASIVEDLNKNLDFMAHSFNGSGYINLGQMQDGQYQVRDKSQRKLWVINVKNHVAK